jgi:hypothetical protein
MFNINQIVKGKKAGYFVVLANRIIAGEQLVQVKPVNPNDFSKVGKGELALPADSLVAL